MTPKEILISDNGISRVWRTDPPSGWVYKSEPLFMIENEVWCYEALADSGYVPKCERWDIEIIRTEDLGPSQRVTDPEAYLRHRIDVLNALWRCGIRHGDLTKHSVLPIDNKPYIIDFAESRIWNDPRPDKWPEGDKHWLNKTMREQAVCNGRSPEMWKHIRAYVDFKNKSVADFGCGHGDMLLYAHSAGASAAVGYEHDAEVTIKARQRISDLPHSISVVCTDINDVSVVDGIKGPIFDIAICFSVLPYVNMTPMLRKLYAMASQTLIECQYAGDGPGTVADDDEMRGHLEAAGWRTIRNIGQTHVEDRDKWRTIWLCEK